MEVGDVKVEAGAPEGAAQAAGNGSAAEAPDRGAGLRLPTNDVRRKRPPALSFLLRMETVRTLARIASLLALDFAGVFLAIYTALSIKALVRDGFDAQTIFTETRHTVAFAYLVTALLFARSGLSANRAQRPGRSSSARASRSRRWRTRWPTAATRSSWWATPHSRRARRTG